MTDLENFC